MRRSKKGGGRIVPDPGGGGGHRNAAGCTINTGLEESERLVLAEIKKILKNR